MKIFMLDIALLLCFLCIRGRVMSIELKNEKIVMGNGNNLNNIKMELIKSGNNDFENSLKRILRNGNSDNTNNNANESVNNKKENKNENESESEIFFTNEDVNANDNASTNDNVSINDNVSTNDNVNTNDNTDSTTNMDEQNSNANIDDENITKENEEFIHRQVMNDLHEKFLIEVINESTLQFLEGLNSEQSGEQNGKENTEYHIELEESCSPFFCEKIMKAKEITPSMNEQNVSNEKKNIDKLYDSLINADTGREIKMHNNNNDNVEENYNNANITSENNKANNVEDNVNAGESCQLRNDLNNKTIESVFEEIFNDKNELIKKREKIVLTDGNNIYVLEEIVGDDNALKNDMDFKELNLNNGITEKEISLHIPTDINETIIVEDFKVDDLDNIENMKIEEDKLFQKNSKKEINEHAVDSQNNYENHIKDDAQMKTFSDKNKLEENLLNDNENENENENKNNLVENAEDNVEDSIFNMKEEDLSKKIFEELKLNNEDKVECYNFSNDADKCSSYKKCTYVNIDNKDLCFLDYNYMLFLKNNNCALQSKSSLLSIAKDLLKSEIIDRQLFQLLRNSSNNNFICDSITYSYLTNVVDNTEYDKIFA